MSSAEGRSLAPSSRQRIALESQTIKERSIRGIARGVRCDTELETFRTKISTQIVRIVVVDAATGVRLMIVVRRLWRQPTVSLDQSSLVPMVGKTRGKDMNVYFTVKV